MIVRKATLSDLDSIMKIENSSFIPEIREEENVFRQRILRCPDLFLVFEEKIEQEGQTFFITTGYLSAEVMNHIPETAEELKLGHIPCTKGTDLFTTGTGTKGTDLFIYISSFALLPEARGSGNGKKAWNMSLQYFENNFNAKGYLLLVNEEWKGAYHIYKESGFNQVVNHHYNGDRPFFANNRDRPFCNNRDIPVCTNPFTNFFPKEDGTFSNGILMIKE